MSISETEKLNVLARLAKMHSELLIHSTQLMPMGLQVHKYEENLYIYSRILCRLWQFQTVQKGTRKRKNLYEI
jgi:hypothetical protein